jgi:hypothetical protein
MFPTTCRNEYSLNVPFCPATGQVEAAEGVPHVSRRRSPKLGVTSLPGAGETVSLGLVSFVAIFVYPSPTGINAADFRPVAARSCFQAPDLPLNCFYACRKARPARLFISAYV